MTAIVALFGIGFGTVGCNEVGAPVQQGSLEQPSQPSQPPADNGEVDMDELNAQLDEVDKVLAEVESKLKAFSIISSSSKVGQQSLNSELRKVFDKMVEAVAKVHGKVDDLRGEINERIAKLDPLNPLHLLAIMKLNEALAYLDELEGRLDDATLKIVEKVDELVAKVEKELAEMDPKNPLTWAALIFWQNIKIEFVNFQARLMDVINS